MTDSRNSDGHLGQRLVFEDSLPLAYKVVEALPQGNEYLSLQMSNEETLHAIMMVEDAPKENPDDSSAEAQDILRFEYKINIMFDLLVGLYQREFEFPPCADVVLRSDALQWQTTDSILLGSCVMVDLHISRKYPKPIILPGTITSEGDNGLLTMTFDDSVGERTRDWIDKFIFRYHRRAVAIARRQLTDTS
ncbi:MAG: PilZ domain-containing protein [Thiotrichales bacterium]|nr:PilZ domain-containing protein [Thiotrichales bacterium]